ncbi:MAG: hypothetical protein K2L72_05355 [Clostridia bacterium]|nr:hypothetical protein [Clostridia bacterium]
MTVLKYMAEQRNRLREKHAGETYLFGNGIEGVPVPARSADEILEEMEKLQGLNKSKRLAARKRGAQTILV